MIHNIQFESGDTTCDKCRFICFRDFGVIGCQLYSIPLFVCKDGEHRIATSFDKVISPSDSGLLIRCEQCIDEFGISNDP